MKTNLDSLFKNSEKLEKEGIEMVISEKTSFFVRRFGGYNSPRIKASIAKHYKPYARQVENGTIAPEKEKEIMAKVFVEACVINWKGIEIDGKDTPYSPEIAMKLLLALPETCEALVAYASDTQNYREDLGNS